MKFAKKILITGGAGFIGSHLVKFFVKKYPNYKIVNIDNLTYAGNLKNLVDINNFSNYFFIKEDICDYKKLMNVFIQHDIDSVIHLAAESHVDRSIEDPFLFVKTNINGTINLLENSKKLWKDNFEKNIFYHISTDEVYGSLENENDLFTEKTPYDPKSPYSASKASSDHFVRAYHNTYKLPVVISNCSNNYGPNQYPEKLIPVIIKNIVTKSDLPIYGKGLNIRDWLFVNDHVRAIDLIFHNGKIGETYNIGGNNEFSNIDLVNKIILITDNLLNRKKGFSKKLIKYVNDRPGHDYRYAIDSSKLSKDLNWSPKTAIDLGLEKTIKWYLNNLDFLNND